MLRRSELGDAAIGFLALYLSVWLYEIGNWVSLTAVGAQTSLVWTGVFPAGVMGDSSQGGAYPLAKLLQTGLCVGVALVALQSIRRRDLPVARITLALVAGMYLSSVYWEALSLTSSIPLVAHETLYVALSVAATFGLLRLFPEVPMANRPGTWTLSLGFLRRPYLALGSLVGRLVGRRG